MSNFKWQMIRSLPLAVLTLALRVGYSLRRV